MSFQPKEFWRDRLEVPAYNVTEAAGYSKVASSTVARWESVRSNRGNLLSVREKGMTLSFLQLIEIAVVARLRKQGVKLAAIARARRWFSERLDGEYPFALESFKTDGVDILQEYHDEAGEVVPDRLVAANESGQLIWRDFIQSRLVEFSYDRGLAVSWQVAGVHSNVVIDPRLSFGAPTVNGLMTRRIRSEWEAGNTPAEISDDLGLDLASINEALSFEGVLRS